MRDYYNESDIWDDCMKLYHAYRARVQRARSRIFDIAQEPSVFVRLSFTDDVLASSEPLERRDWVRRRLKSLSDFYIANIDFGSETEREHYHTVIRLPFWDTNNTSLWPYGYTKAERVRCSGCADDPKSFNRLSEYVSKLALHSLKESTKLSRIIYSRHGKTKTCSFQDS